MLWFVLTAVISVLGHTNAYSSGAPESTCQDMIPRHPVSSQNSTAPYTITTKINVVKSGTPLEVTLKGVKPEDTIRGLLLEARQGDRIVGTFTLDPNDPFAQLINCGSPNSAITHKKHSPEFDKQTVTFIWTPSADLKGEVRFRATIAYNGAVFWVGVESAPVKVN